MTRVLAAFCCVVFVAACEPWSDLEENANCRKLTGRDCDAGTGGGAANDGGTGGGMMGGGSGGGATGGGGGATGGGIGGGAGGGLTGGGAGGGLTGGGAGGGLTGGGSGGGAAGGGSGGGTPVGGGTGGGGSVGLGPDGGCVHDGGVLWTKPFATPAAVRALRVAGYGNRLYWTEVMSDGGTLLSMATLGCEAPTSEASVEIPGSISLLSAGDAGVMAAGISIGRNFNRDLGDAGFYNPGSSTYAVATGSTESATLVGNSGGLGALGLSNNSNLNVVSGGQCGVDVSAGATALLSLGTSRVAAVYSTTNRCIVDSTGVAVDAGIIFTVSSSSTPGPSAVLGPARSVGTFAPAMVSTATGVYVAAQTNAGLRLFHIDANAGSLSPNNYAVSSSAVFARALIELPPNRLLLVGEFTFNPMFGAIPITSSAGTQVYRAVLQQNGSTLNVRAVTTSTSSNFAYGATLIGNQLVMAISCSDSTPPCTQPGVMLLSVAPD